MNNFFRSIFYTLVLSLFGCENNIEVIKNMTNIKDIPSVSANEMEILYSDSAKVKMKVVAKTLNKFTNPEKQYIEFPNGITIYKYDSVTQIEAVIKSNYAIYYESKKLWEARDNVVAKNLKKDEQLYSEELFWDQNKAIIYSNKFTKIINADGVFFGDGGFQSKEDLSSWKLFSIKGTVNIKDNPNVQQNP